ncbi:outer membrane protein assembly factor BamE (lipoprotein component of BamABCDE complex) [Idiomarina fontislapidosi]|uniref:Outer membrane protein assembly factor BamE domain-containing protein n=1 Tax=Idiomarina fontislapidosi TaxID=263723 RepID=A0A432XS05_9GAMM|nr:outer membrane protein assembly factor BamE [Idiomarina fontislapidosi]PYE31144.1 outer membrane protein assembly factor BamE (lipoprotein component of BamABCDE complex) [Idiomarina fontislapidosi]RUO51454.1 hypothetical protein CWE25_11015 [Idiomarina fontislapidosi]
MRWLVWAFMALLISGCASSGTPIDLSAVEQMQKGITTKNQVRSELGSPTSAGITSEGESYFMYVFSRTQVKGESFIPIVGAFVGGATSDIQTLQMWFTEDGVLKNYQFNETTQDVSNGFSSN